MIRCLFHFVGRLAATAWVISLPLRAGIAEDRFDATITLFGGQKTTVENLRLVYSWREMAADAEGLTPYQPRTRFEQCVWVADDVVDGKPGFVPISFRDIDAIKFECEIRQLGVSEVYEFHVGQVTLLRFDGNHRILAKDALHDSYPVLWPLSPGIRFPENAGNKKLDRITTSLRGRTKIEGIDSEYVLVFPPPSSTSTQAAVRRQRAVFPQRIEFHDNAPRAASAGR